MYFLYILRSKKNGSYYTGITNDIDERLNRHNHGWVKATKYLVPWELPYFEQHSGFAAARKREIYIKAQKSRVFIERLISRSNHQGIEYQ